jgi:hypothetical protein
MIALLNSGCYFISDYADNINDFLIDYASYIGALDMKVFKILVSSNEMSIKELIEYINNNAYSHDDKIMEIYELGKNIFR